ncbi:hypothetical protein MMC19_002248 [Ptychographa xylographoides]|nr:hypothetical protein [Ptychographa xylographoides]
MSAIEGGFIDDARQKEWESNERRRTQNRIAQRNFRKRRCQDGKQRGPPANGATKSIETSRTLQHGMFPSDIEDLRTPPDSNYGAESSSATFSAAVSSEVSSPEWGMNAMLSSPRPNHHQILETMAHQEPTHGSYPIMDFSSPVASALPADPAHLPVVSFPRGTKWQPRSMPRQLPFSIRGSPKSTRSHSTIREPHKCNAAMRNRHQTFQNTGLISPPWEQWRSQNPSNADLKMQHSLVPHAAGGRMSLHLAASQGYLEIVHHLLDFGAEIDEPDGAGLTALHYAARSGYPDVVIALLDRNANVNAIDYQGWTALSMATDVGRADVVRLLLQRGADLNTRIR